MARQSFFGAPPAECAITCGVWDPLCKSTLTLVRRTLRHECEGLPLMAVVFDPPPASQLMSEPYPIFEGIEIKAVLLQKAGVTAVSGLSLTREDCGRGAGWFLDRIGKRTRIRKLVIGSHQSLGPAGKGDTRSILSACRDRDIEMVTFASRSKLAQHNYYRMLANGDIQGINRRIGRRLTWFKSRAGSKIALPPGRYRAARSLSPENLNLPHCEMIEIDVRPDGSCCSQDPIGIGQWLGFAEKLS